jgi:hypothetical protein
MNNRAREASAIIKQVLSLLIAYHEARTSCDAYAMVRVRLRDIGADLRTISRAVRTTWRQQISRIAGVFPRGQSHTG